MQFSDGLEFFFDAFLPIGKVKPTRGCLVDAGQMPVAEELVDVREFIAEAGHVDTQFAQSGDQRLAGAHGGSG